MPSYSQHCPPNKTGASRDSKRPILSTQEPLGNPSPPWRMLDKMTSKSLVFLRVLEFFLRTEEKAGAWEGGRALEREAFVGKLGWDQQRGTWRPLQGPPDPSHPICPSDCHCPCTPHPSPCTSLPRNPGRTRVQRTGCGVDRAKEGTARQRQKSWLGA